YVLHGSSPSVPIASRCGDTPQNNPPLLSVLHT
ncbi:hypothetical protein ACVWZC_002162, partial [Thermostichus sp. MS-CIW-18]